MTPTIQVLSVLTGLIGLAVTLTGLGFILFACAIYSLASYPLAFIGAGSFLLGLCLMQFGWVMAHPRE